MSAAQAATFHEDRRAATRRRVLRAAAAAIRTHGPAGVGVAAIMREAGLTHGGFYAHFPSKDALVAAAVEEMLAGGARRYEALTRGLAPHSALEAFIDAYVSAAHRDQPQYGCPLALLNSDMARQSAEVRAAFEGGWRRMTARIAAALPPTARPSREALARVLMAEMAGAVGLSRALSDRAESDRLLADARHSLKARLGPRSEA